MVEMAIKETKITQTILNFLDFVFIYNMLPKKGKKVKWKIGISKKKVSIFLWALFCVWFVGFLLYSNIKIFSKRADLNRELDKLDSTFESLTKEDESLKFSLGQASSETYLEKVAREDLGMQKEGEKVLVIKKGNSTSANRNNGGSILQKVSEWFNSIKERFIKPE